MRLVRIEPGTRECHDAQPQRLRVDFAYPDAKPSPIALEVTSVRDSAHLAGVPAALQAQERLSRVAEQESLGSWLASVVATRNLKTLEREILELVRVGHAILPGHYTVDDLMAQSSDAERQAFMQRHDDLKQKGLQGLERWPSKRENAVWILPMSGVRMIGGFPNDLQAVVDDNAAKLAGVQGYEHHLAVLIGRFDFSGEPQETTVPSFPEEIDRLWIVPSWATGDERIGVWSALRGGATWQLLDA
jgi:hypothetical protein